MIEMAKTRKAEDKSDMSLARAIKKIFKAPSPGVQRPSETIELKVLQMMTRSQVSRSNIESWFDHEHSMHTWLSTVTCLYLTY